MEEEVLVIFLDIYEHLCNSALYEILKESGGNFNILYKYYKKDLIIESEDDLIHLLHTLKFWGVNELPYEVYDYVLANVANAANDAELNIDKLKEIFSDFLYLGEIEILQKYNKEEILGECIKRGYLNLIKYLHENGCPWDKNACYFAAWNGHLDCLQYLHENGCPWDEESCHSAASRGHIDCLKYLHENGCPWDEKACNRAARNGHLDCLKYLHENGCPWDKCTCSEHVSYLECLANANV